MSCKPLAFRRVEGHFKRVDDPTRDVVLDLEDIRQVAIVAVGPQVATGCCIDELRGNPHAIAGAPDRAFEHREHTKLAADGAKVDRASFISEARVARDHRQTGDLRQVGDDVFSDAVGEIFLLRIARHIGEWQNGDRCIRSLQPRIGPVELLGGSRRGGVPLPDPDRPVDILDADIAAVLKTNVDPIADAFVDDRGDAYPSGVGGGL